MSDGSLFKKWGDFDSNTKIFKCYPENALHLDQVNLVFSST